MVGLGSVRDRVRIRARVGVGVRPASRVDFWRGGKPRVRDRVRDSFREGVRDGVRGRGRIGGRLSSPRRLPPPKGLGEGFGLGLECAGWRAGKKRASAVMLVKGARF